MEFGLNKEQQDSITEKFSLHSNVDQVIIFGSRAMGNYHSGSDIDLALIGDDLRLDELFLIGTELESLSFPINFDLFLFKGISDKDVIDHINRVGKVFYERK